MEPSEEVDRDVWQHVEQSTVVEEKECEEKRGLTFQSNVLEAEGDTAFDLGDLYHLDITVALTETESGEVDSEFNDALTEIEGKKSFPCSKCDKVCKSKGGLTKHTNSKHCDVVCSETDLASDQASSPLCKDTMSSIVESIKANLIEENLYGTEINTSLNTVSSGEALLEALLPLYETFCQKKNHDKLLESFYGLIPRSCELLNCEDFRVSNLIMIHIPDHLVGFYNVSQTSHVEQAASKPVPEIRLNVDLCPTLLGMLFLNYFKQTNERLDDKMTS